MDVLAPSYFAASYFEASYWEMHRVEPSVENQEQVPSLMGAEVVPVAVVVSQEAVSCEGRRRKVDEGDRLEIKSEPTVAGASQVEASCEAHRRKVDEDDRLVIKDSVQLRVALQLNRVFLL